MVIIQIIDALNQAQARNIFNHSLTPLSIMIQGPFINVMSIFVMILVSFS